MEVCDMDTGLLVGRLVLGALMAAHGSQKLLGWFGGHGLTGTGAFFEALGFRPGRLFALAAALSELGGGTLVVLGLLGPVGPALLLAVMIVAAISVHWHNGVFAMNNGIELPLLYAAGAVTIALTGFGRYSLDALLGLGSIWSPGLSWAALAMGVLGGITNLAVRRGPVPSAA
jgi:putative oxidoreductase